MGLLKTGLAALLCALLSQAPVLAAELEVTDAWIREMPPVSSMTAGSMILENETDAPQGLLRAESPDFETVVIHRTVREGGVARMVEQERVSIPARGRLEMKPGDYHVMLIGYRRSLKAGDSVALTLVFDSGLRKELSATVRKPATGGHEHHHHH